MHDPALELVARYSCLSPARAVGGYAVAAATV